MSGELWEASWFVKTLHVNKKALILFIVFLAEGEMWQRMVLETCSGWPASQT